MCNEQSDSNLHMLLNAQSLENSGEVEHWITHLGVTK